ncbi:MAG: hypothetical protein H0U21_17635 [Acidimicrobiia bacterium]|nr:hypothetical protein [Acidimicrobiia bacterium]
MFDTAALTSASGSAPTAADEPELLDRIDALRVLRADTPEERERLLEEIGGSGKVEQDIVKELSKVRPLWQPQLFESAHRHAMRSLEVLDRNGARRAPMPPIGPLEPIASYFVQQVTRWIVRGHQNTLATRVRKLYERREANSAWGSLERTMLRRARIDAALVEAGLKGRQLGLPAFLVGGAFISGTASIIQGMVRAAIGSRLGVILTGVGIALVLVALAWVALYAAAIARRRIRLSTDQSMGALWDTVGAAGTPPKDESYNFAIYAIVLTALAWVVIPLAVWMLFRNTQEPSGTFMGPS